MSFKDHFSSHAAGYAAYRPTYPPELVTFLADTSPATSIAIDCGCGTGQLSIPLAGRFDRVVALDASAAQIASAPAHPRVEYRVAGADAIGEPDGSADLVTVAQAAHWFDLDRFYMEARRVLRRGGILALITPTWRMTGGPPGLPPGAAGIRQLFASFGRIQQHWDIAEAVAEGDAVVVRGTCTVEQDHFLGIYARGRQQVFTATFTHHIVDQQDRR